MFLLLGEVVFSAHGEVWHVVLGEEVRRGSRARFLFFRDGFPEGKRSTNAVFASRETDSAAPGPGRMGRRRLCFWGSSPDVGGGLVVTVPSSIVVPTRSETPKQVST